MALANTSKFVYNELNAKHEIVTTKDLDKWNYDLGTNVSMDTFMSYFSLINDATVSYKLQSFQYKLLHRAHTTNKFAYKIGVWPTDKCTFCEQSPETLVHMFCDCMVSQLFWYRVKQWLQKNLGMNVTLDRLTILLGTHSPIINLCCILGKSYL